MQETEKEIRGTISSLSRLKTHGSKNSRVIESHKWYLHSIFDFFYHKAAESTETISFFGA
jgi:hypothetical protein